MPWYKHDKPNTVSMLIWDIPEKVKQRFKAACKKTGIPMREVLLKYMKDFTKRVKSKKSK